MSLLESLLQEVLDRHEKRRPGPWFQECPFCGAWISMGDEHRNPDPKLNGPDAKPCLILRARAALSVGKDT